MSNSAVSFMPDVTGQFVDVFAALSEPIRVQMIQMMLEKAPDDTPCMAFDEELTIAKSTISYHVSILRHAGLIAVRKEGRRYFYRLRTDQLEAYAPAFLDHLRVQVAAVA